MKKISALIIATLSMTIGNAQNITDGLRYAEESLLGTARYTAMSGAFGALGGDFSAMAINPAGSAVFLNNNASISLALIDRENSTRYFNNPNRSFDTDVNVSNAGAVFVFDHPDEASPWKKFTLGVNYNISRNLSDHIFVSGTGNQSIDSFFLEQAQGLPLNLLELQPGESISDLYQYLGETHGVGAQNALLGFQGYIFDPVDGGNPMNTQYVSNIASGAFDHQYSKFSEGYVGKYTFNMAVQYTDNFFFGLNLNSHIIDYSQSTLLLENNNNEGSLVNTVLFENNLAVLGAGFSAQLGGIGKLSENVRVGLSYDTPTWYRISEETTQYLETDRKVDNQVINEIIDPRVLNIYEDYDLRTPGKVGLSAAYIFDQKGLISIDYSYKNYGEIKFGPDNDPVFIEQNNLISNTLAGASSIKVGGEYRFQELSFRAGFRYEESPYEDKDIMGDLEGFSVGIGYNFGNYNFDMAYARAEQTRNQQLYSVGLTDTASIDTVYRNIIFTLGFNL
ncbi:MAG: hypothetical protein ACI86C_000483 [Candidatus Latescibacterota bacterium]|jgi:hypothetical protein